jgi:hypothetical protein
VAKLTSSTLATAAAAAKAAGKAYKAMLMTCTGTGCGAAGGDTRSCGATRGRGREVIRRRGLAGWHAFVATPNGAGSRRGRRDKSMAPRASAG